MSASKVQLEKWNQSHFKEHSITPQFTWCVSCVGADGCYTQYGPPGPNFLDKNCFVGPMTKEETEGKQS